MELRGRIPNLPIADEAHYILPTPAGEKDMAQLPYKELYLAFRSKVDNPRHFEQKWVEALGVDIGEEWKEVWRRVPKRAEIPESTPKRVLKVVPGVSPTNVVSKGRRCGGGGACAHRFRKARLSVS